MPRMTGGQAVAAALRAEGVDHVFGIVGTHDCPLFDGVYGDPAFKVVTVRHEQGASLMAAGYARASGKVAACFVVPGPGLTNALTGMGMAYSESAPMLVFGGQNALAQLDREGGHFHELTNSVEVARSVCGYTTRVAAPGDIPGIIREAMRAMRCGRPRPAYIEMPLDVQSAEADVMVLPPERYSRPAGDPAEVARAAQALRSAQRAAISTTSTRKRKSRRTSAVCRTAKADSRRCSLAAAKRRRMRRRATAGEHMSLASPRSHATFVQW